MPQIPSSLTMITLHLLCKTLLFFSQSEYHIFYVKNFLLFLRHKNTSSVQQILRLLQSSRCIFYTSSDCFQVITLHFLFNKFLTLSQSLRCILYVRSSCHHTTSLTINFYFSWSYPLITFHPLHKFLTLSKSSRSNSL